jgi:hypothetical protein
MSPSAVQSRGICIDLPCEVNVRITAYPERYYATGWSESIARRAVLLVIGTLVVYLVGLSMQLIATVAFPYPIQYEDGPIISGGQALLHGEELYSDNTQPPYVVSNFPPLYYLADALAQALAGEGLAGPRLLSLASSLLLALVIYRWVTWRTSSRTAALLAAGTLLTLYPIANWMASARVDALATLFGLTGVYVVDRHARDRALWLAVPLMAMAFYTKQTQLAAPLAAGLYLLAISPRRAVRFGSAYLVTLAVPFIALDVATGHRFYHHMIDYNTVQSLWPWRAKQLIKSFLLSYWGYVTIAAVSMLDMLRHARIPLSSIYLVFAAAAAALTVGGTGSDFNHFIELCAVLSLMVGIGIGAVLKSDRTLLRSTVLGVLLLQLAMRVPSVIPGSSVPWLPISMESRGAGFSEPPLWQNWPTSAALSAGDRLMVELARSADPILLEQPAFAFLAGRRPLMDDPFIFTAAARAGQWDQGPLLSNLRRGEVGLVAISIDVRPANVHHTRLTDEMIAAIRENYSLVEVIPYPLLEGPFLYVYRPAPGR